jgi:hypothetical protein
VSFQRDKINDQQNEAAYRFAGAGNSCNSNRCYVFISPFRLSNGRDCHYLQNWSGSRYWTGVLEGKVWIGPLSGGPPEKLGLSYPAEIYQPRKIMVYDADHIKLVKQVDITEKGYYSVELPAGKYTVDINYVGTDWSNDVPRKLTLQPGIHINADITFNIGPDLYVP